MAPLGLKANRFTKASAKSSPASWLRTEDTETLSARVVCTNTFPDGTPPICSWYPSAPGVDGSASISVITQAPSGGLPVRIFTARPQAGLKKLFAQTCNAAIREEKLTPKETVAEFTTHRSTDFRDCCPIRAVIPASIRALTAASV